MKEAILVASFGTTHEDAYNKSIFALKSHIRTTYPAYAVYSAYTSAMVRRSLYKRGKQVDSPEEALSRIADAGFTHVFVLPTHLTAGYEYEKLETALHAYSGNFKHAALARPILSTDADIEEALRAVLLDNPIASGEGLLLMGHGTTHPSNAAYDRCNALIRQRGLGNVYVGTVESEPGLPEGLAYFHKAGVSSLILVPFLFVAGDHAKNDLAGDEESWLTLTNNGGFKARARLKGLGEYEAIRALCMKHLEVVL